MIEIISGTNRPKSRTIQISQLVESIVQQQMPCNMIDLAELNFSSTLSEFSFDKTHNNHAVRLWQQSRLIPSNHWIIVVPEYNGSFPGILKVWIDALSTQDAKDTFFGKKIGLIGVSSGRSGNVRGLDHLTSILHYLDVNVFPFKLPISSVDSLLLKNGEYHNDLISPVSDFVQKYIQFICE
ncbi:MAG: NAD(P)H-dependent oxidoreductase [Saprospiraceae bacterium]